MKRCYIASKIGKDPVKGRQYCLRAMRFGLELVRLGFDMVVPQQWGSSLESAWTRVDYDTWIALGLHQVGTCDYLARIPNESDGADGEVERAVDLGIPVFRLDAELSDEQNALAFKSWSLIQPNRVREDVLDLCRERESMAYLGDPKVLAEKARVARLEADAQWEPTVPALPQPTPPAGHAPGWWPEREREEFKRNWEARFRNVR